jgi:hypothetical protein
MKKLLLVALAALTAGACAPAMARGSVHFGFNIGVPLYSPWYYRPYYAPAYYYPPAYYAPSYYPPTYYQQPAYVPPVVAPPSAPAMVEQPRPAEPPMWHYCAQSQAYYPYVRECPGGWQRVPATPPG